MGSVVQSVVDVGVDVIEGATDLTSDVIKVVPGLEGVADTIEKAGVSIGDTIEKAGVDVGQVLKVASGQYHDDVKDITEFKNKIDAKAKEYNSTLDAFAERMESLVAFHEIFQMALGNQMDEYVAEYNPQLQAMMKEYQAMVARLQSEYDFVIGLTEGNFLESILGSLIMITGGIMSDMGDIISGKADGDTWKRLITTIVTVMAVVVLFFIPGLQGVALAVAVSLAAIVAFMSLDGMYANGAATGAIMGVLDALFNDVLNLDDIIGKDFEKFDKDHEDYQEMVMYTQLALSLASIYAAWTGTTASGVTEMVSTENGFVAADSAAGQAAMGVETSSYLGGTLQVGGSMNTNSFLGVSFSTYSDIYKAYSTAQSIGDVAAANDQYENLKDKLMNDSMKIQDAIESKYRKNFMKHYKDTAYFLQDQQEHIDRYLWGMTAQNMYVDPYGTTPVANIRFSPDKDTRILVFGYEEVFDENRMAGSKNYFKSIIYG